MPYVQLFHYKTATLDHAHDEFWQSDDTHNYEQVKKGMISYQCRNSHNDY